MKRTAIGDAKYHLSLTLAREGGTLLNPNTTENLDLWSDALILNVSDDLDRKGR